MYIVEQGINGEYMCSIHVHRGSKVFTENISVQSIPNYNLGNRKNISDQPMSIIILDCQKNTPDHPTFIVEQCSYGKLIISSHVHRRSKVVTENISVQLQSYVIKKYICSIHVHHKTR